jgi:hypothetical protein
LAGVESVDKEIDFARSILSHNQTLINLVDAKAGIILGVDIAVLALLLSQALTLHDALGESLFIAGVAIVGLSALFGFLAINPARSTDNPATSIFFSSIVKKTREEYRATFKFSPREILDDYLDNIYTLAQIQRAKFVNLSRSLYTLLLGVILIALLVLNLHL